MRYQFGTRLAAPMLPIEIVKRELTIGPFRAAYHQETWESSLRDDLFRFIEERLLPDTDEDIVEVAGSFSAVHDDDRRCGSNSAVRNRYKLDLRLLSVSACEGLCSELVYKNGTFSGARGRPLQLWTKQRLAEYRAEIEQIVALLESFRSGAITKAQCPVCGAAASLQRSPELLQAACSEGCFEIDEHLEDNGKFMHGHFFHKASLLGIPDCSGFREQLALNDEKLAIVYLGKMPVGSLKEAPPGPGDYQLEPLSGYVQLSRALEGKSRVRCALLSGGEETFLVVSGLPGHNMVSVAEAGAS